MGWDRIVARFAVKSVTQHRGGAEVCLFAMTEGDESDRAFWEATPAGEIRMDLVRGDIAAEFKPGDVYNVEFSRKMD